MRFTREIICFIVGITFMNSTAIPLFEKYPTLQDSITHIQLGSYPSPLYKVELSNQLRIKNLYIKDDGYLGTAKFPTGNKMRKLEFLLADAHNKGYSTVCTVGGIGSNHALETAICAQKLGMSAVLVLNDQLQTSVLVRNLKLMVSVGATIIYAPPCYDTHAALEQFASQICATHGYYFIPMGGSNALGTLGYVNAAFELKKQLAEYNLPDPDVIYITLGSAGTAAGLLVGAAAAGLTSKIVLVRISSTSKERAALLQNLVNQTSDYLTTCDPSFPGKHARLIDTQIIIPGLDVQIRHNCVGTGYAAVTPEATRAIKLFFMATGIKLDPTYTGKTLSALVADADKDILKDKTVLFWNTFSYGPFEELTKLVTQKDLALHLPNEIVHYLTDPLQQYDQPI